MFPIRSDRRPSHLDDPQKNAAARNRTGPVVLGAYWERPSTTESHLTVPYNFSLDRLQPIAQTPYRTQRSIGPSDSRVKFTTKKSSMFGYTVRNIKIKIPFDFQFHPAYDSLD
jgi:hypothetical protein